MMVCWWWWWWWWLCKVELVEEVQSRCKGCSSGSPHQIINGAAALAGSSKAVFYLVAHFPSFAIYHIWVKRDTRFNMENLLKRFLEFSNVEETFRINPVWCQFCWNSILTETFIRKYFFPHNQMVAKQPNSKHWYILVEHLISVQILQDFQFSMTQILWWWSGCQMP